MQVDGDYDADGFALVRGLIPPEVARAFLQQIVGAVGGRPIPLSKVRDFPPLLERPAFEIYGAHLQPMLTFLWGLTPTVSQLTGRDLLPTYDYFRLYRAGDICRVHCDRLSCQHSLSLTLDYSDGLCWPLEVGVGEREPSAQITGGWGDEPYASLDMSPGDAVLYQGVTHRHARTMPNPNGWSAHLFLHWVDRDGPYAEHAFDGMDIKRPARFSFA